MADHELNILVRAKGALQAARELGKVDKSLDGISRTAKTGLGNAAANLTSIGVVAGGFALAGLTASVKAASDLHEQTNKTRVVFGAAAEEVIAFSRNSAKAVGLSSAAALDGASSFGNMFRTIGLTGEASAGMSTRLVTLAADMASFNDEDPTEMLLRLRSGLSGEAEPLRRFGVLISAARVQEEAYASGIAKTGEALTEQQKVQARYNLILKDSKIQQGDFARTSGGLANAMRTLRGSFTNIGATVGTAVLPKVAELVVRLNEMVNANLPQIEKFAQQLPGLFDSAVEFGENIPWNTIKDTFIFMGKGAKAALEMFTALPPWVQTAVLTGWGLNKLSGGALGSIVGQLGSGLIKGVLGINAGIVNVNGPVAGGGMPGGGPGGKGGVSLMALGFAGAILAAAVPIGEAFASALPKELKGPGGKGESESQRRIREGQAVMAEKQQQTTERIKVLGVTFGRGQRETKSATDRVRAAASETRREVARGANQVAAAIRAKDLSVTVPVYTTVTVNARLSSAQAQTTITQHKRVGKANGSLGGGSGRAIW